MSQLKSSPLEDAVCLGCGCLCDDIVVHVVGGRIMRSDRTCPLGERWFSDRGSTESPGERWFTTAGKPACLIAGRPVELTAGYDRAADILRQAERPLLFGLAGATCEAVRAAVALADRRGACIDPADDGTAAITTAVQSGGIVTATLGEVRHRAEVVIFWHVDPATTHPRHFERYSLTCAGRFVPRGRADRFCVVVDQRPTATAAEADLFLQVAPGGETAALAALRELLVGEEPHDEGGNDEYRSKMDRLCGQTGVPLAKWQELADRVKAARYTAVFFDPARSTLTPTLSPRERGRPGVLESLLRLAHDLNDPARLVVVPMGAAGNANGAEQVLTWQTGYPYAVSFADGYPRFDPERYSAEAMLASGAADAALVVDAAAVASLSAAARAHLATIPTIVLSCGRSPDRATGRTARLPVCAGSGDPRTTESGDPRTTADADVATLAATVAFRVAVPGIHTGGTVFRVDGVPLALRPAMASQYASAETVLAETSARVGERSLGGTP